MKIDTRSKWLKAGLSGGCAVAALIVSGAAFAQAAPQAAGASEGGIEEIVVTAQRRSERLENVPATVVALTPNTLEKAQVVNIHDISRVAAGVQINFAGVSTQPTIRGVTSLTNGSGNENNVAVYVDGFYISDNLTINQDLANLESIEVLKGPQGTLYGRNATGGAILIRTMDPTDTLSGKFEGSYGKLSERRLSGYLSGPLSDKVGFMVSGSFRDNRGWIKNIVPGNPGRFSGYANPQKQRSFRAKLKAELSDSLTATAAYNYSYTSDTTGNEFSTYTEQPATVLTVTNPFPLVRVPVAYGTSNLVPHQFGTAAANGRNIASGKTNQATLKVEWETPIGKLTSYTGYDTRVIRNDFDFDGSYLFINASEGHPRFKDFQQSADYNITAIRNLDLIIGANYFHEKTKLVNTNFAFSDPLNGGQRLFFFENTRRLKTEAWAIYADATYHLTDKLSIGAGGRYSHDKKFQSITSVNANPAASFAGAPTNATFTKFTPRATVRYELAPRTNVYFTYSKGFRAGSFNASASSIAAAALPIKPETIDSFEIGAKTAQRWFRAEISAFYYDYKNLNTSLTVPNPLNPLSPTVITGNAPKAKIKGIDASITITPVENFNITANAEYLHARFGRFPNSTGAGLDASGVNRFSQVQDWSGLPLSRSPNFSGNIQADYTVPVAGGELELSGNVRYTSSYVVNNLSTYQIDVGNAVLCPDLPGDPCVQSPVAPARAQRFRQKAFTLVDGEIDWYGPDRRYWVGVYGKNLTNKSYRLTYNVSAFGIYSSKAAPITYGVKVGYKFGGESAAAPPPPPPAPPPPPPAPAAPPPPPPPVAQAPGPFIVFFDWDKSDITAEAASILDNAANAYQTTGQAHVVLAGHADRSGSDEYNMGLSQRRADAVKAYLAGKGVPDGAMQTEAFGESKPLVETADGVREPQNRRVEITYGAGM